MVADSSFFSVIFYFYFSHSIAWAREREREPFLSNNGSSGLFSLPCISFFLCCSEIFLLYLLCWWWTRFLITPLVKLVIFHKASLSPLWMNTIIHVKKSQHYPYFKEIWRYLGQNQNLGWTCKLHLWVLWLNQMHFKLHSLHRFSNKSMILVSDMNGMDVGLSQASV